MATFTELVERAARVLVFTGAGISTGSGIPDFRGPQGVWKRRNPVYYNDFLRSEEARIEHWDYKLEGYDAFRNARPNAAHRALVDLERIGRLEVLVTQNIDGLHQDAGSSPERVIELHGTNRLVECVSCGRTGDPAPAFEEFRARRRCPLCPCGGFLKTATVSFGQAMPADKLGRAFEAARRADLAIAIGSSLTVEPAASVPLAARESGASYVILNQGPTAHDALATLRLEGDICAILPPVVSEVVQRLRK
jgi:NAD-dependent deacetylase